MANFRPFSGQHRTIIEQGESSQNNLMVRFLRQANKYGTKLTEIIDPELDYEKFTINGLEILEPEKIYEKKILERKNKFIRSIREDEVQCLGNDTIVMELLGKQIIDKLRKVEYRFCHL